MKRDTLLLIALLLAAVLANHAFAEPDPPPVVVEWAPAAAAGTDEQPQPKPRAAPVVPDDGASPPIHHDAIALPPAPERQGKPATTERPEDGIKIFQLKNVRPEETVPTLQVFFRRVTVSAVPSQRMLIARGPEDDLRKVEALLLRLDASPAADKRFDHVEFDEYGIRRPVQKDTDLPRAPETDRAREDSDVPDAFKGLRFGPLDPRLERHVREGRHLSVKGLRAEFAERDAQAREIAKNKRRELESVQMGIVDTNDVRKAVREAFDARQTLQRRELAELAERLAAIQQLLEAREKMKDEIINRRVEELLNPELDWDASDAPPQTRTEGLRSDPFEPTSQQSKSGIGEIDSDQSAIPAAEQVTQAVQPIGMPVLPNRTPLRVFDRRRSQANPFVDRVGSVTQVSRGGENLVISYGRPISIKKGDILEVSRRPQYNDEPWMRFAEVEVTFVRRDRYASARLVSATPLRIGTWMKPEPGDLVHKPDGEVSAVSERPPEDQTALRTQNTKNLKQIMLALHMYHDFFSHFPPALVKGWQESGKSEHPHSWRVAILPYFGRPEWQALYDQYRFDEPWDSKHNKALLTRMPGVYRSPLDESDSIMTSYFAVVTPDLETDADGWKRGTLFSNPRGTPMREVTDGTSNTIAIVERKRLVPWTYPGDIPFDIDGTVVGIDWPVPELGGWFAEGFHAGFADGSAHFVSKQNDAQTVRHLLLIQDGAVVEPKFVK